MLTKSPRFRASVALLVVVVVLVAGTMIWIYMHQRYVEFRHHDNGQLTLVLDGFARRYPKLTRLYTIGQTAGGNNTLLALEISDQPGQHEPGEAEIKLVANIHGNEVVGREILLHLIEYLLANYQTNDTVQRLVDNTRIHILASMNPDGYEAAQPGDCYGVQGRNNSNNIDLNRDFPERHRYSSYVGQHEAETVHVMAWTRLYPFVLSLSLHGGSLVANYPYDNFNDETNQDWRTPDDETFRYLASLYAENHSDMRHGRCRDVCDESPFTEQDRTFPGGITNGAQWYPIYGGMQDWNYLDADCFELTIEMGCHKYPPPERLEDYWLKHKPSLVAMIGAAYHGIHGFVLDADGNPVPNATITVEGITKTVATFEHGDYWRLLAPNRSYKISASKPGYRAVTAAVQVDLEQSHQQNFTLVKEHDS